MQDLMFLAKKENVIIKMLRKRLSDNGASSVFQAFDPEGIVLNWDEAHMIVLYIDCPVADIEDELVAIKTSNADGKKGFIIIGGADEKEKIAEYIPDDSVMARYSIPIDTVSFINKTCEALGIVDYSEDEGERTILIVDDDAALMSTIRGWLKDDFKIQLANTGMNALKWLADNRPHLILLDCEMPLMSGQEMFVKLKEEDRLKNIPVIFMTGKTDKDSVMQIMSLKPAGYLVKPVEKDKLAATLDDFFSKK